MTTTSILLCLAALLTIYSDSQAAGSINCRKFVYHPKCRGVAAKRADLPAFTRHPVTEADRKHAFHPMCRGVQVKRAPIGHHLVHNTVPRKQEDELSEPEYVPVSFDVTNEALQPLPRRSSPALWAYLAERPSNIMLAHRKLDPETLELSYDYE